MPMPGAATDFLMRLPRTREKEHEIQKKFLALEIGVGELKRSSRRETAQ